ncbi:flagellar protein FlaG [Desulfofalx alkaliphila]|uniref:flagellar protein FlaG n=1 Tax=Desulfofalx alkaliphila TaxID=105483 RepID=UPI0004E0BF88|nr:flagellar protein FlaG [Desulfofalx alkaliphila]
MKIGAGGLQSKLAHEGLTIRQLDPARANKGLDQQRMQNPSLAQKPINADQLFKALARLNQAAQMFNYPLIFKLVRDKEGRQKVRVKNKKTGESQDLEPEEAVKFSFETEHTAGKKFDDYA